MTTVIIPVLHDLKVPMTFSTVDVSGMPALAEWIDLFLQPRYFRGARVSLRSHPDRHCRQ